MTTFQYMLRAALIAAAIQSSATMVARAATPADTLVIAREISSIADWDPAVSQILDVQEINSDLYDRLIGFDPRNPKDLGPMLAESWSVSSDGKVFTFKIRPGVIFQSGNPVTAHDAVFSFRRLLLLEREPSSSMRQLGFTKANIDANVKVTDDMTFVLTLEESYSPSYVLNLLSAVPFSIVDSKILMANEKNGDFGSAWLSARSQGLPTAGSGPFQISNYRASDILVLDRNDKYWRFKPSMRRVIFRHVPEASTQRLLLERADADIVFNLTAQDVDAMKSAKGVKITNSPSRRIVYFGFNMLVKPFDDPRVVEAMKYLIDYQGLEGTVMRNLGKVHQSFIPSGFMGALDENPYKLDVTKAKKLLTDAGLPDGFSFKFIASNRKPEMDLAVSFQATAAQAGVKVEVLNMPASQAIPLYRDRKAEGLQLSYYAGYGDPNANASKFAFNPGALPGADPQAKWPAELTWRLGWYPSELSALTLAAVKEKDDAKRTEAYVKIQREAWKTSPFAIMFQSTLALGMRENVENYRAGSRGPDTSFAFVSKK